MHNAPRSLSQRPSEAVLPKPVRSVAHSLPQQLQERTRVAFHDAILDVADEQFCKRGFEAVRMADIATACGVSIGTLYNHFKGKQAVYEALVERRQERYFELLSAPFPQPDAMAKLSEVIGRTFEFVEKHGLLLEHRNGEATATLGVPSRHGPQLDTSEFRRRYLGILEQLLNEGIQGGAIRNDIPLDELLWTLRSLVSAAIREWVQSSGRWPLVARGRQMVRQFFEGVGRQPLPCEL